MANQVITQCLE